MYLFVIFWVFSYTTICGSDTLLQLISQQYNQMSYLPIKSSLAQFNINSKTHCIAQCARLVSTCNIIVFNPVISPNCALYGESLTIANLILSTDNTVVDFGRNNSNEDRNNQHINS
jgi:hypothetical protein